MNVPDGRRTEYADLGAKRDVAADHRAVCNTVYTYAEGMDLRDWQLYRSVLTPQIEIDYSFFHADQKGPVAADDWVANVEKRLTRLDGTQHAMSNPRTRLDGAAAQCTVYVQAQQVTAIDGATASCLVGAQYTFGLLADGGRWLISAVAVRPMFIIGDERVLAIARA